MKTMRHIISFVSCLTLVLLLSSCYLEVNKQATVNANKLAEDQVEQLLKRLPTALNIDELHGTLHMRFMDEPKVEARFEVLQEGSGSNRPTIVKIDAYRKPYDDLVIQYYKERGWFWVRHDVWTRGLWICYGPEPPLIRALGP